MSDGERRGIVLALLEAKAKDGDVGQGIGADEVGLDFLAVVHPADDANGVAGHLVVGDHDAGSSEARAASPALELVQAAACGICRDDVNLNQGGINPPYRLLERFIPGIGRSGLGAREQGNPCGKKQGDAQQRIGSSC